MKSFAPGIYIVDGPVLSFLPFLYPTCMAIVRLSDGSLWVWSPVELTDELKAEVEALGPVKHILSPNKISQGMG